MPATILRNIQVSTVAVRSLLTAALLAFVACAPSDGFTNEDKVAVRALEEAYRTGWLTNDSAAVMATLAPGAVLMPAGVPPLVGDSAIRAYWWPSDGSQTTIHSYEITVEEVKGTVTWHTCVVVAPCRSRTEIRPGTRHT